MKNREILERVNTLQTIDVRFLTNVAADNDGYAEKGMKGTIVSTLIADESIPDNEVIKITVRYEKFLEHNGALESADYLVPEGLVTATRIDLKTRHEEDIWIDIDAEDFELIQSNYLFDLYKKSTCSSYVEWLETKLLNFLGRPGNDLE